MEAGREPKSMTSSQGHRTTQMAEFEKFITSADVKDSRRRTRVQVLWDKAYEKAKGGDFKSLEMMLGWNQGKPVTMAEVTQKQELSGDDLAELAKSVTAELGADGKPRLKLVSRDEAS